MIYYKMKDTIINPQTGRQVSIYGKLGQSIIQKYVQNGGAEQNQCYLDKNTNRCRKPKNKNELNDPVNCAYHPDTRRCRRSKSRPDDKPKAKPAAKPAAPKAKPAAKPVPKAKEADKPKAKAVPKARAAAEPKARAAAEPKARAAAKPKAKEAAKPKARAAAEPKARAAAKPKARAAAEPKARGAAKPKARAAAKPKADKMFKSDRLSARSYYDKYGQDDTIGDICKPNKKKGNSDDKCLLKRVNDSPYWAAKLKTGNWPEYDGRNVCGKECKLKF